MKMTLHHTEEEAPRITTFYFRPERPVSYEPGQYVELRLPHDNMDNRGDRRLFALSSSPEEPFIGITNKFASRDGSSFKRALQQLPRNASIEISEPRGSFTLPDDPTIPLIFIAGGIGITPFRSMAQSLTNAKQSRNIQLFYMVTQEDEIMFQTLLTRAIPSTTVIVSNPSSSWRGLRGRLDGDFILKRATVLPETVFYISGPESLVAALRHDLESKGVEKDRFVVDPFTGYRAV